MSKDDEISCLTEYFWDTLKAVVDPEIGVSVVDLGMVYSIDVNMRDGHVVVVVEMTLTSPTCPLCDAIIDDVKNTLLSTKKCREVDVNITFDPPWNQDMITAEGKMQLGLL